MYHYILYFSRTFAACDNNICIVSIFLSSDLRKAVIYQEILKTLFTEDPDISVEINESIRNFISKEDLALSQSSDQPEEKRPRLTDNANNHPHTTPQDNNPPNTQTQPNLTKHTSNDFPINIKKEKDINFGAPCPSTSESPVTNQPLENNQPFIEAVPPNADKACLPSTPALNNYLLQSPFGTVSSTELKDLPPQILERINFFSQDSQSFSKNQSKSSDLLDDRGGNICNFLLSKEQMPGNMKFF